MMTARKLGGMVADIGKVGLGTVPPSLPGAKIPGWPLHLRRLGIRSGVGNPVHQSFTLQLSVIGLLQTKRASGLAGPFLFSDVPAASWGDVCGDQAQSTFAQKRDEPTYSVPFYFTEATMPEVEAGLIDLFDDLGELISVGLIETISDGPTIRYSLTDLPCSDDPQPQAQVAA